MQTRTLVLVVVASLSQAGCRLAAPGPIDVAPPEPLAAQVVGVSGEIEFHRDGALDDAPGADPTVLTMAAAVEAAVRNDPGLQQALARWRSARAASEESRFLPNPLISLGLGFAGFTLPDLKVSVGITQEIAAYLQRPRRAAAADDRLRAAAEDALVAALDSVAEVRERYVSIQSIQSQMPVLQARRDILAKLRDFEQLKVDRGEAVRADVTVLEAERASISVDLAEREAELREGRVALARLVGRPSSAAAWSLDAVGGLPAAVGDERAWIATALSRRPEIRALGWELAALGEERALIGTWFWEDSSVGADAEYDEGLALGAGVEFPLRLRDPSSARDAAAAAAEAELRHRITETRRRVIEDVRTAWAAQDSARRTLAVLSTELLPLLERRRAEVETTFRAGESDVVALLLADQALQEVRARRIELEGRAVLARIRLERAAGGSDIAVVAESAPQSASHESHDGGEPR
ncbi:MAG: TolC family protein [Planctomycetes bacterium]|nr:TolC family protein [Planctomycetota bacterium]